MDNIKGLFKKTAKQVGHAAGLASQKAKLKADIMFIERDIKNRQNAFGVQLYDYVCVWSKSPEFFAANDDNILITTLRPPLITAQREISALILKRQVLKEKINVTAASKTASFHSKSENWTETFQNVSKTTLFAGNEAKLKTELSLLEREINSYKYNFGITIYQQFALLEDTKQWLPTDREVRNYYDTCRKDIDNYKAKIHSKQQELQMLDPNYNPNTDNTSQEDNNNNNVTAPTAGGFVPPSYNNNNNGFGSYMNQQQQELQQQNQTDPFGSSSVYMMTSSSQQQHINNSDYFAGITTSNNHNNMYVAPQTATVNNHSDDFFAGTTNTDFLSTSYNNNSTNNPPPLNPQYNPSSFEPQHQLPPVSDAGLFRYGGSSNQQQQQQQSKEPGLDDLF